MTDTFNPKSIFATALLILAVCFSGWLAMNTGHTAANDRDTDPTHLDVFMDDVAVTEFNDQGKTWRQLFSPHVEHFPLNNTSQLTTPHMVMYGDSKNPWNITAINGKTTDGLKKVVLWDNVVITHTQDESNPDTQLRTSLLNVFPETHIASTDKPVTFLQPSTTIHAVGMVANMQQGTIKLLSNAQETYAVTP